MQFQGLQKTTLLDYPGHLAAVVFTAGCNFRCPFCHNSDLVLIEREEADKKTEGGMDGISVENVLKVLEKRKNILQGLCITGGEPTLQEGLSEFIQDVKGMGYLVKLDTNGYRPEVLRSLIERRLIDYIAMDVKNSPQKYSVTTGIKDLNVDIIDESIELIKKSSITHEFRTTVVKELHEMQDLIAMGKWIQGGMSYYIQAFQEGDTVICKGLHGYSEEELRESVMLLQKNVDMNVMLRN